MSSNNFNFFKEKLILREEENQLKKMLEKFQDQQNRLKIEELALISMMKMEREKQTRQAAGPHQAPTSSQITLSESAWSMSSVTSSEMKSYVPVGIMSEDASAINKEFLDLDVAPRVGGLAVYKNGEDEEEEEDSDEEVEQLEALAAAETHQLMSFLDDF